MMGEGPENRPRILFVTYGGGHADIVARIQPHLTSADVRILALTTAAPLLESRGIPHQTLSDLLPLPGYESASERGSPLSEPLWNPDSGIRRRDSDAYLGVSMIDLASRVGEERAFSLYREKGRKAFLPVPFMRTLIGRVRPDIVVVTCLVRMERACTLAARECGVPSVLIDDLFGFSFMDGGLDDAPVLRVPGEELPDHLVVMNDFLRRRALDADLPGDRVHALGQPVFSEWVGRMNRESAAAQHRGARASVLYIAPAREGALYQQAEMVARAASRDPGLKWRFKLHPSTSAGAFAARAPALPDNVEVIADGRAEDLILEADLVVLFRSTVGAMVLMANKPMVVLDAGGESELLPYVSSGAAVRAVDADSLLNHVQALLSGQEREEMSPQARAIFECPPDASRAIARSLIHWAGVSRERRRQGEGIQ